MLVKLTAAQDGSPVWVNPEHVSSIMTVDSRTKVQMHHPISTHINCISGGEINQSIDLMGSFFYIEESPTDAAIALNAAELKFEKETSAD